MAIYLKESKTNVSSSHSRMTKLQSLYYGSALLCLTLQQSLQKKSAVLSLATCPQSQGCSITSKADGMSNRGKENHQSKNGTPNPKQTHAHTLGIGTWGFWQARSLNDCLSSLPLPGAVKLTRVGKESLRPLSFVSGSQKV